MEWQHKIHIEGRLVHVPFEKYLTSEKLDPSFDPLNVRLSQRSGILELSKHETLVADAD